MGFDVKTKLNPTGIFRYFNYIEIFYYFGISKKTLVLDVGYVLDCKITGLMKI